MDWKHVPPAELLAALREVSENRGGGPGLPSGQDTVHFTYKLMHARRPLHGSEREQHRPCAAARVTDGQ